MSENFPWLTLILLLPLAAAILVQFVPRRSAGIIRGVTIAGTGLTAIVVAGVIASLPGASPALGALGLRFSERADWIKALGAGYHLGVDGLSGWLLALNAALFLLGAVVLPARATERTKGFCTLLLVTEAATAGVLLSVDLLLFYFFWEAMLIPLYFLLSGYGGKDRGPATLKFVIYTVAGSLLMLLAIIWVRYQPGQDSFDLESILSHPLPVQARIQFLGIDTLTPIQFAFLGFAIAFAIKVPLVPFHSWLPDLYASCPTAALVFFAGIVSKLGAYGFIRYGLTLFGGTMYEMRWILAAVAVLSIIYAALMALSETDIKRVVAYSSVSHLGFVCLGIFALNANGVNGSIMQMVNHGVIIAALFLVVGLIEARTATRDRHELAGLEKRMPWLYALFLVITLAGLGLPGLNTFAGEFTIMLGAFQLGWVFAVLAGGGVILACWYMLRLHQGLMHGPLQPRTEMVSDLRLGERFMLAPLVVVMIGLGVFPRPIPDVARPSVDNYVAIARGQSPQFAVAGTLGPPPAFPGAR